VIGDSLQTVIEH